MQAASRYYFDRDVSDLDLARARLPAGIIPAPSLWNPVRDLEQAKRRQLYTLNRMVVAAMITSEQASDADTEQVQIVGASPAAADGTIAPEFRDMVLTRVRSELVSLGSAGDGGQTDRSTRRGWG